MTGRDCSAFTITCWLRGPSYEIRQRKLKGGEAHTGDSQRHKAEIRVWPVDTREACASIYKPRPQEDPLAQIGRIVRFEAWQDLPPPLPSAEELEMQKRRLMGLQRALAGDVPPPPQAENLLDELKENDTEATPPES